MVVVRGRGCCWDPQEPGGTSFVLSTSPPNCLKLHETLLFFFFTIFWSWREKEVRKKSRVRLISHIILMCMCGRYLLLTQLSCLSTITQRWRVGTVQPGCIPTHPHNVVHAFCLPLALCFPKISAKGKEIAAACPAWLCLSSAPSVPFPNPAARALTLHHTR